MKEKISIIWREKISPAVQYFFYWLKKTIFILYADYRRYGFNLGRHGKRKTMVNYSGPNEKFLVFLKRRLHNKNLGSRRIKIA